MLKLTISLVLLGLWFSFVPQVYAANPNAIVEDAVRFYFADVPIMIDIAKCETVFRQYNPDGTALHDPTGTYVGIFQISEKMHTPKALSLGFDVRTIDGNIGYARYLYNTSGTGPWKGCLPKTNAQSSVPPVTNLQVVTGSITSNLRMGMTNSQVKLMQKLLNQNNFIITNSGGGSPGNETSYFGPLTREALKRFQCAKGIVCSGDEATTGYGRVGPRTQAALNSL